MHGCIDAWMHGCRDAYSSMHRHRCIDAYDSYDAYMKHQMQESVHGINTNTGRSGEAKPFRVHSCHDVTILSLLYGIETDFLASDEDLLAVGMKPGNDERWRFWPRYASTLAFELVRPKKQNSKSTSSSLSSSDDEECFIRILLNGKPIRSLASLRSNKGILSIDDFSQLIDSLVSKTVQKDGVESDSEEVRDMSNWTG